MPSLDSLTDMIHYPAQFILIKNYMLVGFVILFYLFSGPVQAISIRFFIYIPRQPLRTTLTPFRAISFELPRILIIPINPFTTAGLDDLYQIFAVFIRTVALLPIFDTVVKFYIHF
jgi:hypothetical protein